MLHILYTTDTEKSNSTESKFKAVILTAECSRIPEPGGGLGRKDNGTLSPNPDNLTSEAAIITSAAAGTADRVIAYFDKEVNAADFMKDGYPEKTKFDCTVKTGLDSAFSENTGTKLDVVAILPVANEPKALEILVSQPMTDNANASVSFKDKRTKNNGIDTTNTVNFRLADAREPSVLAVESIGTKKIEVTFSEAVLSQFLEGTSAAFAADNIDNYLIDGQSLKNFGIKNPTKRKSEIAKAEDSDLKRTKKDFGADEGLKDDDGELEVQIYSVTDKTGTDNRHKVTITVGSNHVLAAGTHMLTVRNVGDWAAKTDAARNSVSTQVLPFTVTENAEKPEFTVNIQSPEQYELNFNTGFKVVEGSGQFKTKNSAEKSSILELQEYVNGAWTTISDGTVSGKNPVAVSRVGTDDKKYLVEVTRDWSEVYDFDSTRTDYYNKRLRLHVAAGKLVNVTNNLRNDEINIELNANDAKVTKGGEIMSGADLTSPTVVGITQAVGNNGALQHSWNVEFSEPVKISPEANEEGLTPSQKQAKGINYNASDAERKNKGVPVAFARFVNVNNPSTIIEGIVDEDAFIDAEDMVINVEPESRLSGGDWRLVVGSVSDDYGSTLATDGQVITVDETAVTTDFKMVWAAVSQTEDYNEAGMGDARISDPNLEARRGSYIFVKFNKAVDLATALNENNYALNNQPLPQGASIQANIKGYDDHDNVVDSVTIALPTGSNLLYTRYTMDTLRTQLSINGVVAQGTGEALSGDGMTQLPFNIGQLAASSSDFSTKAGGVKIPETYVTDKTDAVWGNAGSEKYFGNTADGSIKSSREYYEAVKAALNNEQYRKVMIQKEAFTNLTSAAREDDLKAAQAVFGKNLIININRAVDVDFDGAVLDGNVVVSTTDAVDEMLIDNVTINGTATAVRGTSAPLTVEAGSVRDFVFNGTVNKGVYDNAILIKDAYSQSFKLGDDAAVEGAVYVTDTNGFGFDASGRNGFGGELVINSNGVINLKGSLKGSSITVKQAATLNLGVVHKDGTTEDAQIDGANIRIEGAEAKVMITEATSAAVTLPTIVAAAKDVKVYLAENAKPAELGSTNCIKVEKGCNIVEIDKNGQKATSANANENLKVDAINNKTNFVGIQNALDELEGIETSYTYEAFTSGSAIEGIVNGTVTKATLNDSVAQKVAEKLNAVNEIRKPDKSEWVKTDFSVSCSLSGDRALFKEDSTHIWPKDKPGTGTDTITISLTYDKNTYTRTIKITKK